MAVMPPDSRIIRFYLGPAPDYDGRKIVDLWQWTRPQLNASPTAFNRLFPMPDGSYLRGGILLFPDDVNHFKSNPTLQANAKRRKKGKREREKEGKKGTEGTKGTGTGQARLLSFPFESGYNEAST
jgi:hypothetical protein